VTSRFAVWPWPIMHCRVTAYCINPQLVCHIDPEFRCGISDSGKDVWDTEQGYEIMSIMSALCAILKFEAPMDNPFLGVSMLIWPEEGEEGIPNLISSEWNSGNSEQENKKDFDLYVVTIKVKQDNVDLTHMFALKAFKMEDNAKKWMVLDVVPSFIPFIIHDFDEFLSSKNHLSQHLLGAFDEFNLEGGVKVYGFKGHYAHRGFHLQSHTEVGLPYNLADVPNTICLSGVQVE
jgi:hypothetical protein